MPTRKAENELKRNSLSVRLDDQFHQLLTNEAWKRKTNCSEFIRSAVSEKLQREGVATLEQN